MYIVAYAGSKSVKTVAGFVQGSGCDEQFCCCWQIITNLLKIWKMYTLKEF